MRKLQILAAACLALLLVGCESDPYRRGYHRGDRPPPVTTSPPNLATADPLARSATYTCEDQTTITLTEGQRDARAMLNSGLELGLARRGGQYGAPPYEFRVAGDQGTWINQGRAFRCRVK